jgi:hypothetical protein
VKVRVETSLAEAMMSRNPNKVEHDYHPHRQYDSEVPALHREDPDDDE